MEDLKHCPYCGGEAKLIRRKLRIGFHTRGGTYYVHCKSCLCATQPRRKPEDAVAVWNRRANDELD